MIIFDVIFRTKTIKIKLVHGPKNLNQRSKISIKTFHLKLPFAFHAPIYHPYGSVGALPWNNHDGSMHFGADPTAGNLLQLAGRIKTFTEGTDPTSSEIVEILKHMSTAKRLVFIGFAFHKLNMQLIHPEKGEGKRKVGPQCFATTHMVSESDKKVINEQINDLYGINLKINMTNLICGAFFAEFWRSLAF